MQEEVYVLVSGSARIKVEDDVHDLEPWTAVRLSKDVMRSMEAGPEGAEFVLVGAPNTGPGDAITEPEWWQDGRLGRRELDRVALALAGRRAAHVEEDVARRRSAGARCLRRRARCV